MWGNCWAPCEFMLGDVYVHASLLPAGIVCGASSLLAPFDAEKKHLPDSAGNTKLCRSFVFLGWSHGFALFMICVANVLCCCLFSPQLLKGLPSAGAKVVFTLAWTPALVCPDRLSLLAACVANCLLECALCPQIPWLLLVYRRKIMAISPLKWSFFGISMFFVWGEDGEVGWTLKQGSRMRESSQLLRSHPRALWWPAIQGVNDRGQPQCRQVWEEDRWRGWML